MEHSKEPRHISDSFPYIEDTPDPSIARAAKAKDLKSEIKGIAEDIDVATGQTVGGQELIPGALDSLQTAQRDAIAEQQGRQ